ncbi:hypothetical protein JCM10207_006665 [Rhodosporidiobolus poonsookiae]
MHKPSKYTLRVTGVSLLMNVGAGLFGFDTGSIGAITTMEEFERTFGGGKLGELLRGVIVSLILITSGVTGVLAGTVSDKLSRKWTISLGAAIFAIGSAISAGAVTSLGVLMLGRCIAGLGEGLFLSILAVYVSECSPKHLRAQMILIHQLFIAGGVAMGFFVCYGTARIPGSMAWRTPFVLQTASACILAVAAPLMPYSPRWLLSKGRRDEAIQVIDYFVAPEHVNERSELLAIPPGAKLSQWQAMKDIWSPDVRRRTLIGIAVNVFQQLSGIDFVLFFAPLLFQQAGLDPSTSSFIASGVTGLVLVACCMIGYTYIHKVGRRTIWLNGGTAVATCLYVLGALYATGGAGTPVGKWMCLVFIELFAAFYTLSWAMITTLYSSETQPARTRAAATAFGRGMNQLVNFAVALSGPYFLQESSYGPYLTYGTFTAVGVIFGFFFMPEVAGRSLEGIDETFQGSPIAVKMPRFLRSARARQTRQRRSSRSGSATLPGETRADIRRMAVELSTIGERDSAIAVEEGSGDVGLASARQVKV